MDVIGVGGIDFDDHIARFSSRGMTTWVRYILFHPDHHFDLQSCLQGLIYFSIQINSGRLDCNSSFSTSVSFPTTFCSTDRLDMKMIYILYSLSQIECHIKMPATNDN